MRLLTDGPTYLLDYLLIRLDLRAEEGEAEEGTRAYLLMRLLTDGPTD